ncbi:PREDICTED: uncharacterized protein LOC109170288 [Ipomoea nil]|uniref:uncharacterized protein LOC109170288 n=1 Tax=Ipomoea nil TaxID=35883 RepID=UPI00090097C3|nr:PREDICTED: uncharacterized protein LOC109170288 [Ipomoea nil]
MDPTTPSKTSITLSSNLVSLPPLIFSHQHNTTQPNHFPNLLPKTMLSPPNDHVHILDPVTSRDHDYSFDGWEPLNFVTNANHPSKNHEHHHYRGIQFRPDDDHQSGVSSPPLWRQNSPARLRHHHSRAEAIARGQWELMEMVKNMPESCYELSLKDLVEQPARVVVETQEECLMKDYGGGAERVKRQESIKKSTGKMGRSGSMENRGMFLKLVFPISLGLGGSNKKKNPSSSSGSKTLAKVSPKPAVEGSEKSSKSSVDKEWWKKKRSWGSRESDSSNISGSSDGSTTSSSNSTTTPHRRKGFLTSCWSGFNFRKSKSAE